MQPDLLPSHGLVFSPAMILRLVKTPNRGEQKNQGISGNLMVGGTPTTGLKHQTAANSGIYVALAGCNQQPHIVVGENTKPRQKNQ
ncbi:MAG: hypothetical protein ABI402_14855 [Ferruginibacter sp.]